MHGCEIVKVYYLADRLQTISNIPAAKELEENVEDNALLSISTCATVVIAWKQFEDDGLDTQHLSVPSNAPPHHNPFTQAFLHLTHILCQVLVGSSEDILDFEIELLLWPATLPPELSFVNRALSSSESCFLHVLHNAVAVWYYTSRLLTPDEGEESSPAWLLEPNEAMLSFLATLSSSCVKIWVQYGKEFAATWGHIFVLSIVCVMRHTAALLRRLESEDNKGVLIAFLLSLDDLDEALFEESLLSELAAAVGLPLLPGLAAKQELLQRGNYGYPFHMCDSKGVTIYWMFRDLRNMSLRGLRRTFGRM